MASPELLAADLAHCHALLQQGSKSFALASRMLPRRVRAPATVLYAFCRVADDVVDGEGGGVDAVDGLRERLARAYAGRPIDGPVDRALAAVVARECVPGALLDALIEGFGWDAAGRRYETLGDLEAYATRVAGAVGAMMTLLMGARAPDVVARACDLGVAMQLTNVARDVGEDAGRGRVYLPLAWLREAGIDPDAWLARPTHDARTASVVARLLDAADALYARADAGIALLPHDCRVSIRAARLVYADIGRVVARAGFDGITRRAVVPAWRKLWLLARAFRGGAPRRELLAAPPLEATRYLVEACTSAAAGAPP